MLVTKETRRKVLRLAWRLHRDGVTRDPGDALRKAWKLAELYEVNRALFREELRNHIDWTVHAHLMGRRMQLINWLRDQAVTVPTEYFKEEN